ncbi:MAG: 4-(cytidine 5'-diphospho)-2-C-methyl-D-erythritol kinase [Rhodoluna sp.]|jgi:4-diphosphocytidyl-2-C-methyl-D-erythritol kinase|nr:4-(cytidine 5'-diphospho)-2-C-methyl-D-erythritol kinase [Rhodoluna sp.]
MTIQVSASAPGKINIFFKVGALKSDGYHDVLSVYQALDIRETVKVADSSRWRVSVSGALSEEQIAAVPTGEDNLVVRAAKSIGQLANLTRVSELSFEITKNVPVAGGMGGGSADAAAAMLAVDELWDTQVDGEALMKAAAELGADIPFALLGGTAIGIGRGDKLDPIDDVQKLHWVLVPMDAGLSTPRVYAKLDEMRAAKGQDPTLVPVPEVPYELIDALVHGDAREVAKHLHNDLQDAAVALMPELSITMHAGLAAGALAAMVSGSGPTIAMLAESEGAAESIANHLAFEGYIAIPTFGPAKGTLLEKN